MSENLYFIGTTVSGGNPLPIEQAVYTWMYDDKAHGWGHRHAILWTPYNENSGTPGREGFLGIGHARGSYTSPFNGVTYPDADLIVMNVFDPCAQWQYAAPPEVPDPPAPAPEAPPPVPGTHSVLGAAKLPTWVVIENQPFELGTWPGNWQISDANGATDGEYTWVAANCRKFAGDFSGMAVGGGDGSSAECADHYPNNAKSWAIFGPFSLADAIAAEVQIKAWVYTEPNHDWLCLTASLDRKEFNGPCVSGDSGVSEDHLGWVDERLDLNRVYKFGSLLGRSNVYIALTFLSDAAGTKPHQGVFVDNVVLRKAVIGDPSASNRVESAKTAAGDPLPGVAITDEVGHRTMTDRDGSFSLTGLSAGKHLLTPSKDGYQFYPPVVEVDLRNGNVANVSFVGTTSTHYNIYLPVALRGR